MKRIILVILLISPLLFSQCRHVKKYKDKIVDKIEQIKPRQKQTEKKKTVKQDSVKKKPVDIHSPVAVYTDNLDDNNESNDLKVRVYPTEIPTQFKVVMEYGKNKAESNVFYPDAEHYQEVALRKSSKPDACLLGFIGKDGKFYEMKEVICSSTQIRIKNKKAYYFETK